MEACDILDNYFNFLRIIISIYANAYIKCTVCIAIVYDVIVGTCTVFKS